MQNRSYLVGPIIEINECFVFELKKVFSIGNPKDFAYHFPAKVFIIYYLYPSLSNYSHWVRACTNVELLVVKIAAN